MKIITLEQVKLYLGIEDTSSDSKINTYIPIIDAKVKQICRNLYSRQILCKIVSGSTTVRLLGIVDSRGRRNIWPTPEMLDLMADLPTGTRIEGDGIPSLAYIDDVEYSGDGHDDVYVPSFYLNEAATTSNESAYLKAGINIAQLPTIAKGVQFLINGQTTRIKDDSWKSKSFGPVSISKGDDSRIDGVSGMPIWFVKALRRNMA